MKTLPSTLLCLALFQLSYAYGPGGNRRHSFRKTEATKDPSLASAGISTQAQLGSGPIIFNSGSVVVPSGSIANPSGSAGIHGFNEGFSSSHVNKDVISHTIDDGQTNSGITDEEFRSVITTRFNNPSGDSGSSDSIHGLTDDTFKVENNRNGGNSDLGSYLPPVLDYNSEVGYSPETNIPGTQQFVNPPISAASALPDNENKFSIESSQYQPTEISGHEISVVRHNGDGTGIHSIQTGGRQTISIAGHETPGNDQNIYNSDKREDTKEPGSGGGYSIQNSGRNLRRDRNRGYGGQDIRYQLRGDRNRGYGGHNFGHNLNFHRYGEHEGDYSNQNRNSGDIGRRRTY